MYHKKKEMLFVLFSVDWANFVRASNESLLRPARHLAEIPAALAGRKLSVELIGELITGV